MAANKKAKSVLAYTASTAKQISATLDLVDAWAPAQNHPAWYAHMPVDGLVNLNFGRRETAVTTNPDSIMLDDEKTGLKRLAPLDAVVTLELTRPRTNKMNAALDEAAGIILNQMRAVATTTTPYTKEDIIVYLENARYVMAAYAMGRRIADTLGMADAYDADAYFKYALMSFPFGTKWSDVYPERAQLDAALSSLTPVLRNLFPANVDVIERMKWLFSNIFVDSASRKYSTKCFKANRWEVIDSEGVAHIFVMKNEDGLKLITDLADTIPAVTVDTTTVGDTDFGTYATVHVREATPLGLMTIIREMISIMTLNTMTSRIAGDLLKAFGQEAFMSIPPYTPCKQAPFVYDEDVLNQIQNTSICGLVYGYDPINHIPVYPRGRICGSMASKVITTYRNEVPAERTLAITRLAAFLNEAAYYDGETEEMLNIPTTCGTETVEAYSYITVAGDLPKSEQYLVPHLTHGAPSAAELKLVFDAWSSDDWAPMTSLIVSGEFCFLVDAQNWAIMREADQIIFTNLATLSLYNIPFIVAKQDTFKFVS